jgi:hypothetical protein
MILLDAADTWQLVMQPDHADLAAQFPAAWGNSEFASVRARDSMIMVAARHDDGWCVRERWLEVHDDGRPVSFIEVDAISHMAFYRAGIVDVTRRDRYAGLMAAMHGAGLYRRRYGAQPELPLLPDAEEHMDLVLAFLSEMEDSFADRRAAVGIEESEQWASYRLLQLFDRLSLYFCGMPKLGDGAGFTLGPVPLDYNGTETELTLTPLAPFAPFAPRHIRIEPYPFAESPAIFTLDRRVLAKRPRTGEEFRRELLETPTETIELRTER